MRLILALSIALGTANLLVVPTETGLDRMTHAADSPRELVATSTHARHTPRQARTAAAFDRTPAIVNIATREVGATPSGIPTGFTMRVAADSANLATDDVTTAEATAAIVVR